jgi:hypothetical protein
MANNFFLPFGVAAGANAWSDATYNGSSQQQTGIQKGIVPSGLMTKAWRQSSVPASALGQIIADYALVDAVDDGNVAGFKANLRIAVAAMLAGVSFAVDQSSTPNVISASLDPIPPNLSFRGVFVRIANTNTGGPVTMALNALGTKGVVKKNGGPLLAGDLVAGQFTHFIYDNIAGQWTLAGPAISDISSATLTTINTLRIVGGVPTFYGAGTTNVPVAANVTARLVFRGGGGGGGGASSVTSAGSGGGGGGYGEEIITTNVATVLQVIVGTGGAGGAGGSPPGQGVSGGTTTWSVVSGSITDGSGNIYTAGQSICSATGGGYGSGGNGGAQSTFFGAGGVATGGVYNRPGQSGGFPRGQFTNNAYLGGVGGISPLSGGPPGDNLGAAGITGTSPGTGGGGSSNNAPGGNGVDGEAAIYK